MGQLDFFWVAEDFFISLFISTVAVVFFPSLWSQCARDGYGSDGTSALLRIQGLASYQHDLSRAAKLTWSMLDWNLEGGPWRKGRDCYFHYCTLWQSFGWLHSKSWESVSAIIVYPPPLPLHKCTDCPFKVFSFTLAPCARPLLTSHWTSLLFVCLEEQEEKADDLFRRLLLLSRITH